MQCAARQAAIRQTLIDGLDAERQYRLPTPRSALKAPNARAKRLHTLLASSRHGAELLIRGHGFSRGVLSSVVRRKLAATEREVVMAGDKAIEVVRFRITAAGRRAIAAEG